MNDVAREAGVALKTVSRFVNGATNIDPVLRSRIESAIEALDYRRNIAAASLRPGQSTMTLGLVISDIGNPYYSALTRAIERAARPLGYLLTVSSSEEDPDLLHRIISRQIGQRTDGLIVVPPRGLTDELARHARALPPTVLVDRPDPSGAHHTVLADNAGGAFDATSELLERTGPTVAFVGDSFDIFTMSKRLAGYRQAFEAHGLTPSAALLVETARTVDDAVNAIRALLTSARDLTGLFCANNRSTLGASIVFRDFGRRVPLIGFDDFEGALLTAPPTSVVAQDIDEMGREAVRLLMDRLADRPGPVETVSVPTRLVLRASHLPDR